MEVETGVPSSGEMLEEVESGRIRSLTLTLYPEEQGYVLTIPTANGSEVASRDFTYQERELLEAVDARAVPWFLCDLLAGLPVPLFRRGCLPLRIRDRRTSATSSAESLVVLSPSLLSLTKDLDRLLAADTTLTPAQSRQLEAAFWATLAPDDVSFDTDVDLPPTSARPVAATAFPSEARAAKRRARAKVRAAGQLFSSKVLNLGPELIESRLQSWRSIVPYWKSGGGGGGLSASGDGSPASLGERRLAAAVGGGSGAAGPELVPVEEMTVEMATGDATAASSRTRILISRHSEDGSFWGQLRLDSPHLHAQPIHSGPFILGMETDARHYVYQYLDMVTEGGRKHPISVLRNTPNTKS